jgi:glutathione S-transferase
MRFVEVEEARAAAGLRLVIAGGVPSPWSQGALGLCDLKGAEGLMVRYRRGADAVTRWTGAHNVPVAMFDDEPPRTGWAEILTRTDRLPGPALVPTDDDGSARLFGLAHEILGEDGLGWSVRLLLVHASFTTEGREGWPLPVAKYLAPKYGYAPERVEGSRLRARAVLDLLDRTLAESQARGHAYLLGAVPSALDVYCAAGLGMIVAMPHEVCPMLAPVRHAIETLDPTVRSAVTPALLAHRALMFDRHLTLPVRL